MARDDYKDRAREGRARDDRYQGSGDERDLGYRDEPQPRRDRVDGSGRGGVGGGMGRETGGGYAGRPEDAARPMRYDRDDYDAGSSRQGLRGGRGEGPGRDASYDRDDARYDAYGADGSARDRERGTMGGSMGGNAGWREGAERYGAGGAHERGRDDRFDRDRAREQWERSMHGDSRWESDYRGGSGSTGGGIQRGLQGGGTMGDFGGTRDHRSEYGRGYAHDYGREGDYGMRGGGSSGRPGGYDEGRQAGGNWFSGAHGGAPDRNPGQGFGGFGYSNADEEVGRAGWGDRGRQGAGRDVAARDHTGRGPRNYQRSDERIRDDVCERLTRHREIDASDIDIDVREGVVTLSGQVEDKHAKRLAEDVAEEVMGVSEVRNELRAARGGVLGALFGRGRSHHGEEHYEREVARDTARDSTRDTARTGTVGAAPPSDLGSVGATSVGPSGAAGAGGARNASEPTTPDASTGRGEPRRGRGTASDG
jgi:osmotically-inducible protein OsmY